MQAQQSIVPPLPAGFEFVRLLSERGSSTVTLARATNGSLVAVKLLHLASGIAPAEALARHRLLQKLTHHKGLMPILDCGLTAEGGWLWESMPLADDVDGAVGSEKTDYTPATLRLRVIERGSINAQETARAGALLCEALACLHAAGLVHRDIKPANLFIVGGEVKLGDYGLASAPGRPFDFNGTEGFQPVEGGADQAADLFALGKALYEIWTGCDRLEFPSLPKRSAERADWNPFGQQLNAVLLRACHRQANARFNSAEEFRRELLRAADGTGPGVSRRRWITTLAAGSAAGAAGVLLQSRHRQAPKSKGVVAQWKLLRRWDHIPSMWTRKHLAVDSKEKVIHSLECQKSVAACYSIQLETLELNLRTVPGAICREFGSLGCCILWNGRSGVLRVDAGRCGDWTRAPASSARSEVRVRPTRILETRLIGIQSRSDSGYSEVMDCFEFATGAGSLINRAANGCNLSRTSQGGSRGAANTDGSCNTKRILECFSLAGTATQPAVKASALPA
ncbi:MAG: hypothetical protein HYY23_10980 [Verrucomicrobia bacterium]|nr:hypothetical protein [Verrucomicrobiota bacterium]